MQNHGTNIIKILNRKIIFIKLHILVHSGLNCNNGNSQNADLLKAQLSIRKLRRCPR